MGSENLNAIEEITALGHRVELAGEADIEPIRQRVQRIASMFPGDPEVQRAAEETSRLIMSRANSLRWPSWIATFPGSPPAAPPGPPTIPQGAMSASQIPPPVPPQAGPPVTSQVDWKKALWIGIAVGIGLSLLMIVVLVNVARRRNISVPDLTATPAGVAVQIATTPPGASIRVNGEARCTSDCALTLPPGTYQITARFWMGTSLRPAA